MSSESQTMRGSAAQFTTTHWSVVLAAGQAGSQESQQALARLCQTYWYPLYAYARRQGRSPHDAQDLTQAFFEQLLSGPLLARATPQKGRFRSFLLCSFKNFLLDQWDKARAEKRGGGKVFSLDEQSAEARYRFEPTDPASADKLYERRWAMTLLDQTLQRLEQEYIAARKENLFRQLEPILIGEKKSQTYADVGTQLRMTEGAVKIAAHRLQRRYRNLLREEIARTVQDPAEIDDELRHLFSALAG
ncbi:MAG: sigma factor [Verrucomicrobiota bacterium]